MIEYLICSFSLIAFILVMLSDITNWQMMPLRSHGHM